MTPLLKSTVFLYDRLVSITDFRKIIAGRIKSKQTNYSENSEQTSKVKFSRLNAESFDIQTIAMLCKCKFYSCVSLSSDKMHDFQISVVYQFVFFCSRIMFHLTKKRTGIVGAPRALDFIT